MAEKSKVQQFSPGEETPFGPAPPPPPSSLGLDTDLYPHRVISSDRSHGTQLIRKKQLNPPRLRFGDFLDLFTVSSPSVPKKEPSEDTVDIPREFAPPVNGCYLEDNKPPSEQYKAFVRTPSKKYRRPRGLDGKSYSTESDERLRRYERCGKEETEEIRIKIHWCTTCGRWRSRRYHRANPLMPGRRPTMGICSRCVPMEATSSGEKKGKKETEEILVHRIKAPRSWFRRPSRDTIRITRERSSDRPPEAPEDPPPRVAPRRSEKRSSSSEKDKGRRYRVIRRVIVRPHEKSPPPEEDPPQEYESDERIAYRRLHTVRGTSGPQADPPRDKHRRRSSSTSSEDRAHERQRYIDRKIASHPNAWSRGQVVTRRTEPERWVCYKQNRAPRPCQIPPRPPSPPEWYYRRTYTAPNPIEGRESRRLNQERELYDRIVASERRESPLLRPAIRESYDVQQGESRRRRARDEDDDDDERERRGSRQVRFEPKPTNLRQQKMHREALEDKIEARRDQYEFDEHKHQIRRGVSKGGGQFELDGHNSEDIRRSESTPYIQDSYRHVLVPSPRRGSSKGTISLPVSEDAGSMARPLDPPSGSRSDSSRHSPGRTQSYPSHSTSSHSPAQLSHSASDTRASGSGSERWTATSLFPQNNPAQRPQYFNRAKSTDISIFSTRSASGSRSPSFRSQASGTPSPKSQVELPDSADVPRVELDDARSVTTQELNDVYKESIGSLVSSLADDVGTSTRSRDSNQDEPGILGTTRAKALAHLNESQQGKDSTSDHVAPREQPSWDETPPIWDTSGGTTRDRGGTTW